MFESEKGPPKQAYRQPADLYIAATIESLLAGSALSAYFILNEGQKQFEGQIAEKSVVEVPKTEEKMEVNWGAPEELVEETLELDWG